MKKNAKGSVLADTKRNVSSPKNPTHKKSIADSTIMQDSSSFSTDKEVLKQAKKSLDSMTTKAYLKKIPFAEQVAQDIEEIKSQAREGYVSIGEANRMIYDACKKTLKKEQQIVERNYLPRKDFEAFTQYCLKYHIDKKIAERDYVYLPKFEDRLKFCSNFINKDMIENQKVRDALEKVRKKHCLIWKDGCKNTAGLCEYCEIIEDLEEELKINAGSKEN